MQITIDQALAVLAGVSSLVALGGQAYAAYRSNQWGQLLVLAGDVTYQIAGLAGMTNEAKRKEAERRLYDLAPEPARRMFTPEQFAQAVEYGWELLAKPRIKGAQVAPARRAG